MNDNNLEEGAYCEKEHDEISYANNWDDGLIRFF